MSTFIKSIYSLVFIAVWNSSAVADTGRAHPVINTDKQFELSRADGSTVKFEDFEGRLSLVYFGYTNCLMQSPPTWVNFERVHALLGADANDVQLTFISLDPKRDTVEQLARWQQDWPHIQGLTGTAGQIDAAADAFGIFYARRPDHAMRSAMPMMTRIKKQYGSDKRIKWDANKGQDYHLMDHTTHAFLLDENRNYVTHFELEESPDLISSYIKKYLNR